MSPFPRERLDWEVRSLYSVIKGRQSMESLIAGFALVIIGYMVGSVKVINQGYEGIVERLGRYQRTLKPGLNFVFPFLDMVLVETTREQLMDIKPQAATTRDNVTIQVDVVLSWKILDVQKAYYAIDNLEESLKQLVLTTLSSEIGQIELRETFSSRKKINQALLKEIDQATESWGVKVIRVEVQEIIMSDEVRRQLENERIAESKRKAEITEAEGTVHSIELIAKALQNQPNAQSVLHYLSLRDYVNSNTKLSESSNSKIIFMDPKSLSETVGELIGADTTEGIGPAHPSDGA